MLEAINQSRPKGLAIVATVWLLASASLSLPVAANEVGDVAEIVFAVRVKYDDPHWYANIGYYCDDENQKAYAGNGAAGCRAALQARRDIAVRSRTCLNDPGGSVRDPQIHYDAGKVLFSYRKAGIALLPPVRDQSRRTGLRQITSGEFDDYEPAYLPDGGIVFVSTRCNCWVNCWMTQVGVALPLRRGRQRTSDGCRTTPSTTTRRG